MSKQETQKAIPFVEVIEDRFHINEEAVEFIESLPQPLAVIACAGGYRTGKSLFLNRGLLQLTNGKGFAVGNSTNACTKGLWIHTSLHQVAHTRKDNPTEKEYINILFIDTEGLGAFDANDTHDAKIFALALLLCSYFIYNSVGKIDEDSIGKLSLVCNVCKQIRANASQVENDDQQEAKKRRLDQDSSVDALAEYFPAFLWLLRDFSLKLQDSDGSSITSKQYLENALADKTNTKKDSDVQKSIDEKNQLRKMLRKLFLQRDCATLMRPCVEESQLQSLDSLGDAALRPEFLTQMQALRRKILMDAPAKLALENRPISGRGLVQLARSYVDAFNRGAAPVIRDSWNLLVEVQCRDAIDAAKTNFVTTLATLLQQKCVECKTLTRVNLDKAVCAIVEGVEQQFFRLQLTPFVLEEMLNISFESATQKYSLICGDQKDDYRVKLETMLDLLANRVRNGNAQALEQLASQIISETFQNVFSQLIVQTKQSLDAKEKVKPLWPQLLRRIEQDAQDLLAQKISIDPILKNILQKILKSRYEQWIPSIEEHWIHSLRLQTEDQILLLKNLQQQTLDLKHKLDTQQEACESHLRERDQLSALVDYEKKINFEQKTMFEATFAKQQEQEKILLENQLAEQSALEKELQDVKIAHETSLSELQQRLLDLSSENTAATVERDSAITALANFEKRCEAMSFTINRFQDENEALLERIKIAEQTASRLRTCEVDYQQSKQELTRIKNEYGLQLSQLERDSVQSLEKIRTINEKSRTEQDEKIRNLNDQLEAMQITQTETKKSFETQLFYASEKIITLKNELVSLSEKSAIEQQQLRDRLQATEQSMIDAKEQHKQNLQSTIVKFEQDAKQALIMAREEAKRVAQERSEMQKKLNEAATDAACQRVRNEHLQNKLQDDSSRGELQQVKKDFDRAVQQSEKLRAENDKLLGQQRAHQHQLEECERRIELATKKLQEQEREFSAERIRLRLRFEEENSQQAYRLITTVDDKKKK